MRCHILKGNVKCAVKSSCRSTRTKKRAETIAKRCCITHALKGIGAARLPGNTYFGEIRLLDDEGVARMLVNGFTCGVGGIFNGKRHIAKARKK